MGSAGRIGRTMYREIGEHRESREYERTGSAGDHKGIEIGKSMENRDIIEYRESRENREIRECRECREQGELGDREVQ